MIHIKIGDQ